LLIFIYFRIKIRNALGNSQLQYLLLSFISMVIGLHEENKAIYVCCDGITVLFLQNQDIVIINQDFLVNIIENSNSKKNKNVNII
jgi:hypothetical protein